MTYKEFKEKVSYEDLYNYYEIENHSGKECLEHFGVSSCMFNKLLKEYNIHKSKDAHVKQIKKTKLERYGDENYNNLEQIKQTNLEKYEVENQFQRKDFITDSWLNSFGADHPMHNEVIKKKSIDNHNYKEITKKSSNTYYLKTGYVNPRKDPEIKKKIVNTLSEICKEKYGYDYFCMRPEAKNYKKNSKCNIRFSETLSQNEILYLEEFPIKSFQYDFKIGNNLIEINPTPTHNSTWSPFGTPKDINYHYNKTKAANEQCFRCIHVWDWDDPDKIINMFKDRETVYGRKCELKEVDKNEAEEFITKYHFQNYSRDSIRIGLYYNDELVSIMTFGKSRYNKNYEYELIRYCSSKNVIGGSKKIFDYFINSYNPSSVISYCDMSKFSGNTYTDLGFKLLKWNKPSKHWYNIVEERHITDNLLRQLGADKLLGTNYGKGSSNEKIMLENGYVVIYDCGQASYIWKKD